MDNAVNFPPPTDSEADFWKGFLLGAVTGMVIAAYTYVMTDFNLQSPTRRFGPAKPISKKNVA